MDKNYKVVFTAPKQVELVEWDMPNVGDDDILIKLAVSQISTGTELTMLEANVEEDSPWWQNIAFPNYDVGYSAVVRLLPLARMWILPNLAKESLFRLITKSTLSFPQMQQKD